MTDASNISPLLLPLDAEQATLELAGGKGASLARLVRADLPVPPGFHITTAAYRRFVAGSGIEAAILSAASRADGDGALDALEHAAAEIAALFAATAIDDELAAQIVAAYAGLCGANGAEPDCPVAVRSSATAEDLPELSFAGQQESYLNIRGTAELLDAVKRCWASLWTARAISYRARHSIAPGDVSLAVVVQALVPAEVAGIMFTADPLSGRRDHVMINAAWGLGEAIVGGLVTPDTIVVDKQTGTTLRYEVAAKDIMTAPAAGGTTEAPVPPGQRSTPSLAPREIAELLRLGARIEQLYGQPMDIEWAREPERLWVVQARPITALPEGPSVRPAGQHAAAAWVLPDPKRKYMRASVIELLPDPLSPLFETLALPHWNQAMLELQEQFGFAGTIENMLTTINGYAYYSLDYSGFNLQFWRAIPRIVQVIGDWLPRAEQRWREQGRVPYEQTARQWEASDLAATPAVALLDGVEQITAAAANHYLKVQSGLLPAAYISELAFTQVYEQLVRRSGDPPALAFLLGIPSTPLRAEQSLFELAMWAREAPGLPAYLEHNPAERIAAELHEHAAPDGVPPEAWHELGRRFAAHLEHFGHTVYDLDFAKPVPADDPAPLLDALRYFVSGAASDPGVRRKAAAAERDSATAAVLRRTRGLRLALFWKLLRTAQAYAPLREDALADVGLGWPVLRRMLAEIGGRLQSAGALDSAGDIYWLRAGEVRALAGALDAGSSIDDQRSTVAQRRAAWSDERKQTPPVALPVDGGSKVFGIDWSSVLPARSTQDEGAIIRGIGTSPGKVTAPARVIGGPDEFGTLQPGDILVARITTPAWTPLFGRAGGVVTDIGGPLSHGSIVAREYRIPAVLGTGVATERIAGGQRVAVDGDAGTVTLE